jgi:hypothetical protein
MTKLTQQQIEEHEAASERMVSLPHRGPHAIFSNGDLQVLRFLLPVRVPDWSDEENAKLAEINAKLDAALTSDPRFREPFS